VWTFGKRIALGFAVAFLLLAVIGVVAYRSIDTLTRNSHAVAHTHQVLEHVVGVRAAMVGAETGQRGFVITGDPAFLDSYHDSTAAATNLLKELRELTADNPNQQKRLDELRPLVAAKFAEQEKTIGLRKASGFEPVAKVVEGGEGKKIMDDVRQLLGQMEQEERDLLQQRADEAEHAAADGRTAIIWGTVICLLFVGIAGTFVTRTLTHRISQAVQQMQSSSAELQAAVNQQVTGTKESATSMSEIATTISELLATSRQISESARRVAQIAEQTLSSARGGNGTVDQAQESIAAIRRQVDQVVGHMLNLGKKSQQIGAVVDIVGELAEQTNILAINASIEAAGATENGKRFAVVADEIRKLADRVASSTKEIRTLIDDVRSAVNTTVMATETGSKAVESGARQFNEVAATFKQIAGSVNVTTEAAREIELSTKQQATAVEQVNVAIANVAQASRESEVSSTQTLQTISQLARLSTDLLHMVRPQAAA
jgi:CHASE3 domain sensor protein